MEGGVEDLLVQDYISLRRESENVIQTVQAGSGVNDVLVQGCKICLQLLYQRFESRTLLKALWCQTWLVMFLEALYLRLTNIIDANFTFFGVHSHTLKLVFW